MNRRLALASLLILVALAPLTGCDDDATVLARSEPLEVVTGTITDIDDRVPVDGGVTIAVDLAGGGTDTLYMPSMFTSPPPDPGLVEIYRAIGGLKVGDEVRASGVRTEAGLRIEALELVVD